MAARAAGVSSSTYYRWLERGSLERDRRDAGARADQAESRYLSFLERIEQAEATAEATLVATLFQAGRAGDTRAAFGILERRWRRRWGRGRADQAGEPSGLRELLDRMWRRDRGKKGGGRAGAK